jgi:hypothetical protein
MLPRLFLRYEHAPIEPDCYDDPEWNRILRDYRERLGDTALLMPTGALACARNLARLSGGRLLLLSADKGHNHEHALLERAEPQPAVHGSFSLSVNYHAMGRWFEARQGATLHTTEREANLVASAFLLGAPPAAFSSTRQAFADAVEGFGPTDFYLLQEGVRKAISSKARLPHLLAMLRLSGFDPSLFYMLREPLLALVEQASPTQQREMHRAIERIWDNYYSIGESKDLAFEAGRVLGRMKRHGDAIAYYEQSLRTFGDHHATWYNLGLCRFHLDGFDEALRCFERALELDSSFDPARSWRLRTIAEIEARSR